MRTHSRNHANNSPIFQLSAVQFTFHRSFYTRKEGLVDTYRSCDRFQSSLLVNLYRSMRHTRNRSNQFFTRNLVLERNLSFSFLYTLFTDALNFHDTRHCYDILLLLEYIFNVFVQVLTRQFLIKLHTKKYHFFPSHDLETTYNRIIIFPLHEYSYMRNQCWYRDAKYDILKEKCGIRFIER